jgi:hypothetical protein
MRTLILAAPLASCIPAAVFAQGKGAKSSDTASSSSSRASYAPSSARSPTSRDRAHLFAQQDGDLEKLIGGRP